MRALETLTLFLVLALKVLPLPWVMASDAQSTMWLVAARDAPALL